MDIQKLNNKWQNELANAKIQDKYAIQKKINEVQKIFDIEKIIAQYAEESKATQDQELKECYNEEINNLQKQIENQKQTLIENLMPHNKESIIMEIRSGEGGQEAELFSLELMEMYQKLSKKQNWIFKIMQTQFKESGGIKEASIELTGQDLSLWLQQESGVHCVKRVPKTEKKGRTHTSTATVAILKQPSEIEIVIKDKDLRIDIFRSSGPGGQSVNTTDSAVRITHLPSGLVVSQQDEKSQHMNKEKAMKILRARLYAIEEEKKHNEEAQLRKQAIGTAKRNERIRTYHFTQNWVNDSRIEKKCHDIAKFMSGDDLITFLNELLYNII